MPYTSRKILHRLVDFIMPRNCRKELKIAAAQNAASCLDAICLLREHNEKKSGSLRYGKVHAVK